MKRLKIITLFVIPLLLLACTKHSTTIKEYDWNDGYCSECGGVLRYSATGSKEHYICEECGQEYTFDRVMSKK